MLVRGGLKGNSASGTMPKCSLWRHPDNFDAASSKKALYIICLRVMDMKVARFLLILWEGKMIRISSKLLVFTGVLLLVAACAGRVAPLYNVVQAPLDVPRSVSTAELEKTIRVAAANRGWTVKRMGRGKIEARIAVRDHVAVIDISYSRKQYSITYKESQNLKYDGSRIHKNYNSWIQLLANDINARVSAL